MKNPTCFISYSWDNDEHKDWVRELATELQHKGIETKLDQWDCHLGMDLMKYMETCVRESDFVLLICTPKFCQKANNGQGGVGYEKNIVTGEIFEGISSPKKFVPILRKGSSMDSLPSYLKSRLFIDFRNENKFKLNIDELIRHLHNSPKYERPPLGEKPNLSEEVKKQTEFMEIDRYVKEMDNLVAPLYSKKDATYIFTKKNFGYQNIRGEGVPEYLDFWEKIERYKYLGSAELRSAIDNYLKSKSDEKDESYAKAKKELVEAIKNRYSELGIIIRNSEEKV